MKILRYLFVLVLILTLHSCSKESYSIYIDKNNPEKKELELLFPLLDKNKDYSETRFTIMNNIFQLLQKNESSGKLNLFITSYIDENPNDPYNSYYLLSLSSIYLKNNQKDFAYRYLQKAVMNYKDLTIRGDSTHFKALEILIDITPDNEYKVLYLNKLIKNHRERIEKRDIFLGGIGELYYKLGKTLEIQEKWDESIVAYENFLNESSSIIPSEPDARDNIATKVGFYHSDKRWVVKDLDTLVYYVKQGIINRRPELLDKYRAFDFFIINWNSKYSDLLSSFPMESNVLTSMSLTVARSLDALSTDNEAYLAINGVGWQNSIWYVFTTWYLYFKKVDFPMDPEIHGGWEWAGIYLGEKL